MKISAATLKAGVQYAVIYTTTALVIAGIVISLISLHILQMTCLDIGPSSFDQFLRTQELPLHEFDPLNENSTDPLDGPFPVRTPANSPGNAFSDATENKLTPHHSLDPLFFIFGDSTVDCGNNNSDGIFGRTHQPPYGRDFDTHVATGRFSNGRLVVDYLASLMGLPLPRPFLGPAGRIETVVRGLNFASAGAGVLHPNGSDLGQRTLLTQQIEDATDAIEQISLILGRETTNQIISKAIFYISIGSVDYIDFYLRNDSGVRSLHPPWKFNQLLVEAISTEVEHLYNATARKFVCVGLEPLGCAPHFLFERNSSEGECIKDINNMVIEYNFALRYMVHQLNHKLPGATIIFCNIYDATMDIVHNPGSYGFKTASDACCGQGKYGGGIICASPDMACANASSYVWWDSYHPTDRVNSIMADNIWSGKHKKICHPMNLHDLAMG